MDRRLDWLAFQIICQSANWIKYRAIDADHWLGRWCVPRAASYARRKIIAARGSAIIPHDGEKP